MCAHHRLNYRRNCPSALISHFLTFRAIVNGCQFILQPTSCSLLHKRLIIILVLSLDVMDESGEHISEYDHDVYKERLDASGKTILKEKSEGTAVK